MKRTLLFAAAVFLIVGFSASAAWAFGVKDVVRMHRDGVADSLIIQKVKHSGKEFHLDADDLRRLKQAGVSDAVVSAMLATEDRNGGAYAYGPYYYPHYAYYPYYDPYFYPYYPRVMVGLGYSYYGYHRPYYYRSSLGPRVFHGSIGFRGDRRFR